MDISKALEILGLTSNPSLVEVKKAYREQVKLWHPDRYSNGSVMKEKAQKNIQDANLAYAFLKRHLPATSKKVSRRPSKTMRNSQSAPRMLVITKVIDQAIQLLGSLSQRFPKIHLRPVLEWLQHDARNQYRPWYRYPPPSDAEHKGRENESFDLALQKAMENRSQIKRIHRMRRSTRHKIREDTVTPISGVSKSVKSNQT